MKTTTIVKSLVAAILLTSSAPVLLAQSATTACPFGQTPGYGRMLTPEQRVAHRAVMQQWVTELRAKLAAGTITAEESAWLEQVEKHGGGCIDGVPRGQRASKGAAHGKGYGQRRGLGDGTGPRSATGTCPLGNLPAEGESR